MQPASRIVDLLGGPAKVAEILNVNKSQVWRWRNSRKFGGTGGNIPHWHVEPLVKYAREHGIALEPQDFAVHVE